MSGVRLLIDAAYLASALLFVAGLRRMAKVRSARAGIRLVGAALLVAVLATVLDVGGGDYGLIAPLAAVGALAGAGLGFSGTGLGTVALATAAGGAGAALFAAGAAWAEEADSGKLENLAAALGNGMPSGYLAAPALVTALIAGAAALGGGVALALKGRTKAAASGSERGAIWIAILVASVALVFVTAFWVEDPATRHLWLLASAILGLIAGLVFAVPIGDRDRPAAVAVINASTGLAASALGFLVLNNALLIAGGIDLAASLTLASVLSAGMSRTLGNLFAGGGTQSTVDSGGLKYSNVRSCGVQEAAMVLEDAHSVVIVPGFGYAVAQAQNATRELAQLLEKRGAKVRYAVHPMAGRMPGHMNLLLSEADVPYGQLYEPEQINDDLRATDVVLVVGGNDIINPDAENDRTSAVYGMPPLRVAQARSVFVVKRSLRPGHTGARNPLFEADNTMLLFGDAKKVLQSIATELKSGGGLHAA